MLQEEIALRQAFYALEKSYRPYFDVLTENQNIYSEYKGAVTINGFLNFKPDILLLSYNPAHGLYRDWNKEQSHLVYTGERPFELFEWGLARQGGHWYETNKPQNHTFLANCIEFFYEYHAQITGHNEYDTQKKPSWWHSKDGNFDTKLVTLNIYPFGTDNCDALTKLFKKMKENNVLPEFKQLKNEWEIRKGFIRKMHEFIENYVKPKAILCLGTQTTSDYLWGQYQDKGNGIYINKNYPNIVGISRSGNWKNRAKVAAKMIAKINNEKD